ncbi:MAG: DUF881 domain-containing protein [Alicyclobacillaceae bacterium]|nr:DUF881 domain-containing protein [Alicyclobacillaceae bacterium]
MMQRVGTAALLTLVGVVLGFMLTVQMRTTGEANRASVTPLRLEEPARLSQALSAVRRANADLEARIRDLQGQIEGYEKSLNDEMESVAPLRKQLETCEIISGAVPVHGPGVVVTIDDHHGPVPAGVDARYAIVHDFDIRRVVNELFAAGAEAVSVNGQRIAMRTGVVCIGPTIRVGGARLVPPFTIEAIGDPGRLQEQLNRPGGILDVLRSRSVSVTGPKADADLHLGSAAGAQSG